MNDQHCINGVTVEKVNGDSDVAEAGIDTSGRDIDTVADYQVSSAADLVYDLSIDNQTLLWKAQPKPTNTNQV